MCGCPVSKRATKDNEYVNLYFVRKEIFLFYHSNLKIWSLLNPFRTLPGEIWIGMLTPKCTYQQQTLIVGLVWITRQTDKRHATPRVEYGN